MRKSNAASRAAQEKGKQPSWCVTVAVVSADAPPHTGSISRPEVAVLAKGVSASVDKTGAFVREDSVFRGWVRSGGKFEPEKGRYCLYVANACPWAHRTRIVRHLKGLEDVIELAFVDFLLDEEGWRFEHPDRPEESKDTVHGFKRLRNVYSLSAGHDYTGRVTVPVLFDKKTDKIVNNESSDIIQMLNSEFNHLCLTPQHALLDLYPAEKKVEIDALNSLVYDSLNNGVYKAGFAQSQLAYDNAVKGVFETLEKLELRLEKNRWLFGSELTLADVRLFTTLIRFDPIYFSHFKCSKKMLESYKNLWGFTRDLFTVPNVASTIDIENARKHYFLSHTSINPFHILPIAREINYDVPHERRKM